MKKHALLSKTMTFVMFALLISSIGGVMANQFTEDNPNPEDPTTETEDPTTETEDPTTETEEEDTTETTEVEDEHEPEYEKDDNGTVWVQTDIMTIRMDADKPSYQFWYSSDDNGSLAKFSVSYLLIIEFEDLNGDGVFQVNETIAFVPLDAFDWVLKTGSVTNSLGQNEEVYATYTKGGLSSEDWDDDYFEDWMPEHEDEEEEEFSLAGGDENETAYEFIEYKHMTVQFYGHIYMDDYQGTVSDDEGVKANYTIDGGIEFKIDVKIGNFPFISNTSKITLLNYLEEDLGTEDESDHYFRTHEDDGDDDHESEDVDDDVGERFEDLDEDNDGEDDDIQEISLIQGDTNTTHGFYRWLDKAKMILPNSTAQIVDVGASYWTDGDAMLLFLAYPNFDGGLLIHDPSMKLEEAETPIPTTNPYQALPPEVTMAAAVIATVVVVAAAVAVKRR